MRDCLLTKCVVAYVAIVSLSLSSLLAQEVPKSDDESFDIEPPLLVKPWEPQSAPDDSGESSPARSPQARAAIGRSEKKRGRHRTAGQKWGAVKSRSGAASITRR